MHHVFVLSKGRLKGLEVLQALSKDWVYYFLLEEVDHPGKWIFFGLEVELFLSAYLIHPSQFVDPSLIVICLALSLETFLRFLHDFILSLIIISVYGHHLGDMQIREVLEVRIRTIPSLHWQRFGLSLFDALGIMELKGVVFTHYKRIRVKMIL